MGRLFRMMCVTAAGLGLAAGASATSLVPLTVEQLTDAADYIVRGEVDDVWTEVDARAWVYTRAYVRVDEALKGRADVGDYLLVSEIGGEYGGAVNNVEGAARFSTGEPVWLFLNEVHAGEDLVPVGMFQGKYTIRQNPADGSDMVVRVTMPYTRKYDARFLPHPPADQRVSLASLRSRVEGRLALGWDGAPIPGVASDHLRAINKLQAGVK
jgi:hypothetical protein